MIKIAICDDEREFRDTAESMLRQYMEDKSITFETDSFDGSSKLVDATEKGIIYDIYLLDIYMPGITGMSIATELRSRNVKSPIIFLTTSTDNTMDTLEGATLNYTITKNGQPLVDNVVATFTTDKNAQSSTIHISAGDPDFAGNYKDTVTFTVTVKSPAPRVNN